MMDIKNVLSYLYGHAAQCRDRQALAKAAGKPDAEAAYTWAALQIEECLEVKLPPKKVKVRLSDEVVSNPNFDKADGNSRCCNNEKRNMNGGCDNCGDPSF